MDRRLDFNAVLLRHKKAAYKDHQESKSSKRDAFTRFLSDAAEWARGITPRTLCATVGACKTP